jgi:hypothetical protein
MPIQEPTIVKATMTPLPHGQAIPVDFNPASLVYSVENSIQQQSAGPKKVQYVAQLSGKLTMDLQFDTTGSGADVRTETNKIAQFMQPSGNASAAAQTAAAQMQNDNQSGPPPKAPPVLLFQWGSYQFQGIMDSFKETIDFFSSEGVALRALVSIQLSRQDLVFDEGTQFKSTASQTSLAPSSSSDSALSMATRGGDPNAMRQLGSDNGLDSLRFTDGASLEVSAGVQLNPPAAFVTASASAGLGLGAGISAGASAGISLGASAGVSIGASAGFGASASASAGFSLGASAGVSAGVSLSGMAPAIGASASAGVPASLGAFSGLQAGVATTSTTANLNPLRMVAATSSADVATYNGASFNVGGAALSTGSAGLSADVGQQFDYSARLTFSRDD